MKIYHANIIISPKRGSPFSINFVIQAEASEIAYEIANKYCKNRTSSHKYLYYIDIIEIVFYDNMYLIY